MNVGCVTIDDEMEITVQYEVQVEGNDFYMTALYIMCNLYV